MNKHPGHRALRRGRFSVANQMYVLTTTTLQRRCLFSDWDCAKLTCRIIADKPTWGDACLMCWVLMPDHWHGLIGLGDRDSLPVVVNRFKARVAKGLHGDLDRITPIWARAYHDRALRQEDDMLDCARYLVLNPVRAGLVSRVNDYPFWDAIWL